jgi:hypothetical protein
MVDKVRVCRLCEGTTTVAWRFGWDDEATGRKVWLCNPCGLRWSSSRRARSPSRSSPHTTRKRPREPQPEDAVPNRRHKSSELAEATDAARARAREAASRAAARANADANANANANANVPPLSTTTIPDGVSRSKTKMTKMPTINTRTSVKTRFKPEPEVEVEFEVEDALGTKTNRASSPRFVGFRFDPEAYPDSDGSRVVRVFLEDESGADSLVAVGRTPPGFERYFRYVATKPPPDGFRGEALPEEGVTKEACERWIRDACPRIKLRRRGDEATEEKGTARAKERAAAKAAAKAAKATAKATAKAKGSSNGASAGSGRTRVGFHDAAIPFVLGYDHAEERKRAREDGSGRRTRRFYLAARDDNRRLLAVEGVESEARDKHYRYLVSTQLLRVAVDAAGRPFANVPRIQNARDADEWLRAVIEKSAAPPLELLRSITAARADRADRRVRENRNTSDEDGDEDYEDYEDYDEGGAVTPEMTRAALARRLGAELFEWCAGESDPSTTTRLTLARCRIDRGLAGGRGPRLTNRDAMGILNEIDERFCAAGKINAATLEETQVARAVARLATEEAGMAPEVAESAARLVVRWRRSAELCVEALERKE